MRIDPEILLLQTFNLIKSEFSFNINGDNDIEFIIKYGGDGSNMCFFCRLFIFKKQIEIWLDPIPGWPFYCRIFCIEYIKETDIYIYTHDLFRKFD